MKEIILDLRKLKETEDEEGNLGIADDPAHIELEGLMYDYVGEIIRLKITVVATPKEE